MFPTVTLYKAYLSGEKLVFMWYDSSTKASGRSQEFKGLATMIRKNITKEGGLYQINFNPPCEMSCPPPGLGETSLCFPFNREEKLAFFREYTLPVGEEL